MIEVHPTQTDAVVDRQQPLDHEQVEHLVAQVLRLQSAIIDC